MQSQVHPAELLQFYIDIGVDETIAEQTQDRTKVSEKPSVLSMPKSAPAAPKTEKPVGAFEALGDAREIAAKATTIEELRAALENFEGLTLKRTATQMVFADGNPKSDIMFVGEAPGADEDRMGLPFVGVSGRLLDTMLSYIGLDRDSFYISNVINWRPPGNRNPSDAEIALSLPFIRRHIELVNPKVLVFVGGVAAKSLMETTQGITRLRGRWQDYTSEGLEKPVDSMAIFHPAYLLRSPAQKAHVWADLLKIQKKLGGVRGVL